MWLKSERFFLFFKNVDLGDDKHRVFLVAPLETVFGSYNILRSFLVFTA